MVLLTVVVVMEESDEPDVGRTGGTAEAEEVGVVVVVEVEVEVARQRRSGAQDRSVGQQPPPRLAGQE